MHTFMQIVAIGVGLGCLYAFSTMIEDILTDFAEFCEDIADKRKIE